MTPGEFTSRLFGIAMTRTQKDVMEAVNNGKLKIIGYDIGAPNGDKSCKIYGKVSNGQIIIDDIEVRDDTQT